MQVNNEIKYFKSLSAISKYLNTPVYRLYNHHKYTFYFSIERIENLQINNLQQLKTI